MNIQRTNSINFNGKLIFNINTVAEPVLEERLPKLSKLFEEKTAELFQGDTFTLKRGINTPTLLTGKSSHSYFNGKLGEFTDIGVKKLFEIKDDNELVEKIIKLLKIFQQKQDYLYHFEPLCKMFNDTGVHTNDFEHIFDIAINNATRKRLDADQCLRDFIIA